MILESGIGILLIVVSAEMKLSPNVGSDRSWVWNVAADFAENSDPVPETLAIRFGNSESEFWSIPTFFSCFLDRIVKRKGWSLPNKRDT
jgi:Ran-binding protein 1